MIPKRKPKRVTVRPSASRKFIDSNDLKKDNSIWKRTKDFINSLENGSEFTRQELLNFIHTDAFTYICTTVDVYRKIFTNLGFVKYKSTSIYIKVWSIPSSLKLDIAKKEAYPKESWKEWFIPLYKRLGVKEEECPPQEK